ncbi:glutathione peroxidase [Paludibacter jiangxiensis]|uniref:Glutathione peroxidase n=1 Tax=Paludibacter jiangxiensis TaxID=681398 RepID=A0A170Z822_9BACT|nr:glutathione peroxidase [Paludibacter jiangxiensis]GAT62411.1 glutathione peroxidase [Paludibacter jiangxiensis]
MNPSFYQLSAKLLRGQKVSMEEYKGKVVLVVNTASQCGLTPQFEGLEALYQKYKERGFVVLGFPCNQFAHQEPGTEDDISQVCHMNYGVTFPMFAKVDVNGENAHPVFKYLTLTLKGLFFNRIKWNFTKFLIDAEGVPVKRFAPVTKPEHLEKEIERLLSRRK